MEKKVNAIVRALRSSKQGIKELQTVCRKSGICLNELTIQAIVAGLKDAERASLSSKVVWR
jgi:hypothetical protein